jgi:hypothetical protein
VTEAGQCQLECADATAECGVCFTQQNREAGLRENDRCWKAIRSGTDDDRIVARHEDSRFQETDFIDICSVTYGRSACILPVEKRSGVRLGLWPVPPTQLFTIHAIADLKFLRGEIMAVDGRFGVVFGLHVVRSPAEIAGRHGAGVTMAAIWKIKSADGIRTFIDITVCSAGRTKITLSEGNVSRDYFCLR